MLYTETIEPNTLSVLKDLLKLPVLKNFSLVGGTALSLLFGHRKSVNLDLFFNKKFENDMVINEMKKKFGKQLNIRTSTGFGIFGFVDEVKVDLVRHPHPLIRPTQEHDGVRMFSTEDIMA